MAQGDEVLSKDDKTGRTQARSDSYLYDLAANLTNIDGTPYTYDGSNAYTGAGTELDGDSLTENGASLTWDERSKLTAITANGNTLTNGYDATGLRVWSSLGTCDKKFYIYDGGTLLGEVDNNAAYRAVYTWGAAGLVSEHLNPSVNGGGSYWYHFGPQGETRQLTDGNGNVVDQYWYTPYGDQITHTGLIVNPFRFGGAFGYYRDSSGAGGQPTGKFLLCGARWYDPTLGRFLSRDPQGYQGGQNLYAYCGGDPISDVDPAGMDAQSDQYNWMDDDSPRADVMFQSDVQPDIGGLTAGANVVEGGLQFLPFYNTITALSGRDVWGRCLKTSDRVSRGIQGAFSDVPILGGAMGEVGCWIKGGCFTAGAPVVMKDGTTKPVESVVQGDEVLSKDEKTGGIEARRVEQVSRRTVGQVVRVTLTDPVTHQSQTLTATEDHPFYVQGKGFMPAGQLGVGTSIVTRAGPALTVSGSVFLPQQVGGYVVYNLTVAGDHTYFVGNVNGGAWVHNTCPKMRSHFDNVVRPAFWKNEAKVNAANWSQPDIDLMLKGRAPKGPDGFSYELHHINPLDAGGTNAFSNLKIMSRTDHRLGGNFKLNHP